MSISIEMKCNRGSSGLKIEHLTYLMFKLDSILEVEIHGAMLPSAIQPDRTLTAKL